MMRLEAVAAEIFCRCRLEIRMDHSPSWIGCWKRTASACLTMPLTWPRYATRRKDTATCIWEFGPQSFTLDISSMPMYVM